jgi:hypothetical protein
MNQAFSDPPIDAPITGIAAGTRRLVSCVDGNTEAKADTDGDSNAAAQVQR